MSPHLSHTLSKPAPFIVSMSGMSPWGSGLRARATVHWVAVRRWPEDVRGWQAKIAARRWCRRLLFMSARISRGNNLEGHPA